MTFLGHCTCASVQYEIQGELSDVAFCHCSACRRTLGAAFGSYARVDPESFKWIFGEKVVSRYESSPGVDRCFCSKCGSPLGAAVGGKKLNWVSLGTVNGDPEVRPIAHIFVGSKAPWYEITDDLPQFNEWPPASSEFSQLFD